MSIEKLVNDFMLKLITAIMLASFIIISIAHFANIFHNYIQQFSQARSLEIFSFAMLLFISLISLYFLFKSKPDSNRSNIEKETKNAPVSIDLQSLVFKFVDGLTEGLTAKKD